MDDLAVSDRPQLKGIATASIPEREAIAAVRAPYVIFLHADIGDAPGITLFTRLGIQEDVLHFDIGVMAGNGAV